LKTSVAGQRLGRARATINGATKTDIVGNYASGNAEAGIALFLSTGNKISGNFLNNNTFGIELGGDESRGTNNNILTGNQTLLSGYAGIYSMNNASGNRYSGNVMQNSYNIDFFDSNACGVDKFSEDVFTTSIGACLQ
jgi:parallel beta-helix repeat protein